MNGGRTRRHLGALALTVGVLAAGLAACTDDPSPHPSATTPSTTPVTSTALPSPTATPPTAPKAEPTPKSAEAFVKYFWAVYNYAYETRDQKILKTLSAPHCLFCQDTIKAIEKLVEDGSYIKGSEIQVGVAVAPPTKPAAGLIIATVISERPGMTIASDGSTVGQTKGVRDMKSEIALDWTGGKWIVRDLANDEKTGKPW